jgi:Rrf2 family protein
VGAREVSEKTGVPAAYVAKIFQALARAGIVSSERGKSGGYSFRKDPAAITLYDVVCLTDDLAGSPLSGCVMGLKSCSDADPCPLHPIWARSREEILAKLRRTSISNVSDSMRKSTLTGERRGKLSRHVRAVFGAGAPRGRQMKENRWKARHSILSDKKRGGER